MSNKLPCPSCGRVHEVREYINALDANHAFTVALRIPAEIATDVLGYIELFAPKKQAMQMKVRVKLIETLLDMNATAEQLKYGIGIMLEKVAMGQLNLPLTSHNYLKKVMAGYEPKVKADDFCLSDKQVKFFGIRLIQDSDFAMTYAKTGESGGEFMVRVEAELAEPDKVKEYMPYLEKVGFKR